MQEAFERRIGRAYMKYSIYRLEFSTGVHLGEGMLNSSACTFQADTLFSALYIEALHMGKADKFLEEVKRGNLLLSDAFPYVGSEYLVPKPMLYVEGKEKGNSIEKKKYKKLKYLPVRSLESYLSGEMGMEEEFKIGRLQRNVMAAVRKDGDTEPFYVGTYYFDQGNGLYVIAALKGKEQKELFEELLSSLAYTGIGGKKSSGLGKFEFFSGKNTDCLLGYLQKKSKIKMLMSTALPQVDEMGQALEGANYLLNRRSGFVASGEYAEEMQRKKDLYVFSSGSCFVHEFSGDIYDVSKNGGHPVYRYAKALFLGVS